MKDLYAAQIAKVLTELGQRSIASSLHAIQQRAGVAIRGATMADPVATGLAGFFRRYFGAVAWTIEGRSVSMTAKV